METIRGRMSLHLDWNGFRNRLAQYNHVTLDLGTGDGRFVRTLAERYPQRFIIGVDACRENLREHSRAKLSNMLIVIASAQDLPCEFEGLFSRVTINFPWGSLLEGLLAGDRGLMHGLDGISRPDAQIEICLNSGALKEAGTSLGAGAEIVYGNLHRHGWKLKLPFPMQGEALKKFPSTWARRLAHGPDPYTIILSGRRA
jgi:16S rRNA (adenine(1408)-N(1))-methyltransferase